MDSIEARVAVLELRVAELLELVHSGPSVPWEKSIRGRLHHAEQLDQASANLRIAAREMRRSQVHRWSTRERRLALVVALLGAAAPYLILLLHAYR